MPGPVSLFPPYLGDQVAGSTVPAVAAPTLDAVETDADRLCFLEDEDFGLEVTLFEKGNPGFTPVTFLGIWDREHELVDVGSGVEVSSRRPQLLARDIDLPAVDYDAQDFRITVQGAEFRIDDVEPDGTGLSILRVHRVTP